MAKFYPTLGASRSQINALDVSSVLWEVILKQVEGYFQLDGVWCEGEQKRRNDILQVHVYQGNVFQPNFFIALCDELNMEGQRKWFGHPVPELMFGTVVEEEDEEKD